MVKKHWKLKYCRLEKERESVYIFTYAENFQCMFLYKWRLYSLVWTAKENYTDMQSLMEEMPCIEYLSDILDETKNMFQSYGEKTLQIKDIKTNY